MNNLNKLCFFLPLVFFLMHSPVINLAADETDENHFVSKKHSVDVSFMIADLKYSEKKGVKICEVQHGILSTFLGDRFSHGEPGTVFVNLQNYLTQYQDKLWTVVSHFVDPKIQEQIKSTPNWYTFKGLDKILKSSEFKKCATLPVYDPNNIHSYHGILAAKPNAKGYFSLSKKYPGIILLDKATHPFWIDKLKMTQLFSQDDTLASYKPKWGSYPKKYTKKLAGQIIQDLKCDIFVIKPRGAFLGNGVIIVEKEELQKTLEYILKKSKKLQKDPDSSYSHWYKDFFDSFLVEEFIPSDTISVPHLDNKTYQPTMRVAFLLIYNQHSIEVKILLNYWLLPYYAVSEKGSLNEKHKAYCKPPYFCQVDSETILKVNQELYLALPLLYKQMLSQE